MSRVCPGISLMREKMNSICSQFCIKNTSVCSMTTISIDDKKSQSPLVNLDHVQNRPSCVSSVSSKTDE